MNEYDPDVKGARFTDEQNRQILNSTLPNAVLSKRMGLHPRQVQRQRAWLKAKLKKK